MAALLAIGIVATAFTRELLPLSLMLMRLGELLRTYQSYRIFLMTRAREAAILARSFTSR